MDARGCRRKLPWLGAWVGAGKESAASLQCWVNSRPASGLWRWARKSELDPEVRGWGEEPTVLGPVSSIPMPAFPNSEGQGRCKVLPTAR